MRRNSGPSQIARPSRPSNVIFTSSSEDEDGDAPLLPVNSTTPAQHLKESIQDDLRLLRNRQQVLKKLKKTHTLTETILQEYPKSLRNISLLLAAMPVSQVSVERLFSALKLYKTDLRNRLKEDILSSMLILKTNQ